MITLREAVEAVEGPFRVTRCIMEDRACGEGAPCALHEAWEEGQRTILEYLDDQTLQDFVARSPTAYLSSSPHNPTSLASRKARTSGRPPELGGSSANS